MRRLFLKRWGSEKAKKGQLSILFVCDDEIRKLNRKYRKKNRPTDVLSFPMYERDCLGDIVISVDTAKRYAKRDDMKYEDKMKFLLIHGFLHLLGYDHEISKKEEIRMQKKEREYIKILEGI